MTDAKQKATLAAAIGGTLVVGLIGGIAIGANAGSGAGPDTPGDDDTVVAATDPEFVELVAGRVDAAEDCDDLLAWYVDRGQDLVGPYGWGSGDVIYDDVPVPSEVPDSGDASEDTGSSRPDEGQGSSDTGTNVQETGVDEPDVVKTDGDILVRIEDDDDLTVWDVAGSDPERVGTLELDDIANPELLLVGDQVIVVGSDQESADDDRYYGQGLDSRMITVDISDPAQPEVGQTTTYDGQITAARQYDDTVRLVLAASLPDLDFVEPGVFRDHDSAQERNEQVVADSELSDWLPQVATDGGDPESVVDCADIALPTDDDAGLGTLAILGFDASTTTDPADWSTAGIATTSSITYSSTDALYLADPGSSWGGTWDGSGGGDDGSTRLYEFVLDETSSRLTAVGEVDGRVVDRWSMDEVDGTLRVAVNPSSQTGAFNSVVVFETDDDRLQEIGRVDHLGPDEEIQSVRWYDDQAIVVTFRQTDPFYVVDLADPTDPSLLGELKIPGFSSYLHPIGGDQLIGVGAHGTDTGLTGKAQAALFDISDVSDPTRLSTVKYAAGTVANAGNDPRQFTWLGDRQTAVTVITEDGRTGLVSVLKVDGDTLAERSIEADYGSDVADLRVVPLPDDRVLLMTGSGVEELDL